MQCTCNTLQSELQSEIKSEHFSLVFFPPIKKTKLVQIFFFHVLLSFRVLHRLISRIRFSVLLIQISVTSLMSQYYVSLLTEYEAVSIGNRFVTFRDSALHTFSRGRKFSDIAIFEDETAAKT